MKYDIEKINFLLKKFQEKKKLCPSSAFMEDSLHKSASTIGKQHQGNRQEI
jgi:hypothetical protein